jgi:hypothetical protein
MEVRGYIHPENCFATIAEWEQVAKEFLALQKKGKDTRGGVVDQDPKLADLIMKWFSFQLYIETQRYDSLTQKEVLYFIEDFVNHKVWGLRREFATYFYNDNHDINFIDNIKVAYFYSRGTLEPYVLLDDRLVTDIYGTTHNKVVTLHWTTEQGLINLQDSINQNHTYAISTFTKQWKPFFRPESNVLLQLEGELRGAFKSDVKSFATDRGNRAINMYRLAYPGEKTNMCLDFKDCVGGATSLWNEIIVKPTRLISFKKIQKY